MPHTIVLSDDVLYPPEEQASAAITPGMLVEYGPLGKLRPHATATGAAQRAFACESLVPDFANVTAAVDKVYASGDSVRWAIGDFGTEIWAWMVASGAAVAVGDQLVSAGNGYLQPGAVNPLARAAETLNNSAGATAVRIKIRVA
jgi:hypothetical protein